jgi:hypothetical protein
MSGFDQNVMKISHCIVISPLAEMTSIGRSHRLTAGMHALVLQALQCVFFALI